MGKSYPMEQELTMTEYRSESSQHRPYFALAAVAMTTLSIAVAVVVPASYAPAREGATSTLAVTAGALQPAGITLDPARIEVVGQRIQETELGEAPAPTPGRRS